MRSTIERTTLSTHRYSHRVAAVVLTQKVCTQDEHQFLARKFSGSESWGSIGLEPEPQDPSTLVFRASDYYGAGHESSRPVKLLLPHDVDPLYEAECKEVARATLVQLYRWIDAKHSDVIAL